MKTYDELSVELKNEFKKIISKNNNNNFEGEEGEKQLRFYYNYFLFTLIDFEINNNKKSFLKNYKEFLNKIKKENEMNFAFIEII
jgi:hypothetical protein